MVGIILTCGFVLFLLSLVWLYFDSVSSCTRLSNDWLQLQFDNQKIKYDLDVLNIVYGPFGIGKATLYDKYGMTLVNIKGSSCVIKDGRNCTKRLKSKYNKAVKQHIQKYGVAFIQ